MRYSISVQVENDPPIALELTSLPPIPLPNDTVAIQVPGRTAYGLVLHRHFSVSGPDSCSISLVCRQENK